MGGFLIAQADKPAEFNLPRISQFKALHTGLLIMSSWIYIKTKKNQLGNCLKQENSATIIVADERLGVGQKGFVDPTQKL